MEQQTNRHTAYGSESALLNTNIDVDSCEFLIDLYVTSTAPDLSGLSFGLSLVFGDSPIGCSVLVDLWPGLAAAAVTSHCGSP